MDLIDAIMHNNIKYVKKLLTQGLDPNAILEDDLTPLHFAAAFNAVDIAQLLLTAGANPEEINNEGETALDIAKDCRHYKLMQLLMKTYSVAQRDLS